MKKRSIFFIICSILIVAVTGAAATGYVLLCIPASQAENLQEQLFTVERGASVRAVAAQLKKAGLVRSEYAAYLYFRFSGGKPIRAGAYKLSAAMPVRTLYAYLQDGKQEYIKVTLPEGLTLSKTAAVLEKYNIVGAADFAEAAANKALLAAYGITGTTAEGFLFPDTYFFGYDETAERVLKKLLDTFFEKTAAIPHFPHDPEERYQTVILASIIEREYRVPEEAAKIAGVFRNRMDIGMGLQSCATVEYIMTEIQGKPHPERLLNKDLEIDNPYNTYKWRGLPPGPIANPGLTALSAACNYEKSDYFYFRLEDTEKGTHVFTKTLEEHARARYLTVKRAAGS